MQNYLVLSKLLTLLGPDSCEYTKNLYLERL